MIRVGLADDHPLVREGLKAVIDGTSGMQVVAEASAFPEALRRLHDVGADVWVLDVSMPGGSILGTLQQLQAWGEGHRVLVLSMHPEDSLAVRILRAGAAGYLTKSRAPDELVTAIRRVHAGGRYIPPALAEKLLGLLDDADRPPHEALSDREYSVLMRLARGHRPTDIADELGLSVKTVSTYRSRVLDKLGLSSNADLIRYSLDHDLLS